MGIAKRAYLYVTRKKVRSILLFLIFWAAGLFLLTGVSIKQSTKTEADKFRKTLTTGLWIESHVPDSDSIIERSINEKGEKVLTYTVPLVREHHIREILAIEGVSGFYCDNLQRTEEYTGLKLHPGYCTRQLDIASGKIPLGGEVTEEEVKWAKEDQASMEAYAHKNSFLMVYDSKWHPAFVNGGVELVEGRHINIDDEAKVLVSDEVAEMNGLKIGDKITAQEADFFSGERYGSVYETEIVGIFHVNFDQKITELTYEEDILANILFSTPDIFDWSRYEYQVQYGYTVSAKEEDNVLALMVVYVEDPLLLESVKEKLLMLDIDWQYYKFDTYDKDYQTAAAPLLTMMKISDLLTIISVVGILLILSLVLNIWMRGRTHETGILTSMGIKKNEILGQFMIECCGIAIAAFLAAMLLAGPVTKLTGDVMQTVLYSAGDTRGHEVYIEPGTNDMYVNLLPPAKGEALSYAVTAKEACAVFLILTGTAVVSVFVSSKKILRRKPNEILRG